ncbi:hypothetical protein ACFL4P_01520 [Gemmatimonadota bacterium]
MKEAPMEIIKTLLKSGKVSLIPLGEKGDRYAVELELADGRVVKADSDSVEHTIEKLLAVLDEHAGKKCGKKK